MSDKESEFVEVLSTFDPGIMAIVKSILDVEGVTYYFKGEHLGFIEPVELKRLMVRRIDLERTKELLTDLI